MEQADLHQMSHFEVLISIGSNADRVTDRQTLGATAEFPAAYVNFYPKRLKYSAFKPIASVFPTELISSSVVSFFTPIFTCLHLFE